VQQKIIYKKGDGCSMKSPKLDLFVFSGCENCPLNKNGGPCDRKTFEVEVRFHTDHFKDGIHFRLWRKTEKVRGDAVIDSGIIYCIKAFSTEVKHLYDYVWFSERTVSVRMMMPKKPKKKAITSYGQRFLRSQSSRKE